MGTFHTNVTLSGPGREAEVILGGPDRAEFVSTR